MKRLSLVGWIIRSLQFLFLGATRLVDLGATIVIRLMDGVEMGQNVRIRGCPVIHVVPGARVSLGQGVMLNSRNFGYHLNMFTGVKLMADRPGARIQIGSFTRIHGACIHAYEDIRIGANCLIAANCQIMDGSGHDLAFDAPERRLKTNGNSRPVVIGDSVWIGASSIILPGVVIGEGAVVGAGSVVTKSLPPFSLSAGNPCRVIKVYARDAASAATVLSDTQSGGARELAPGELRRTEK